MPMPTKEQLFSQYTVENPYELHLSDVMKVWVYPDPANAGCIKFKTMHNGKSGLKEHHVHHPFVLQIWKIMQESEHQTLPISEKIVLDEAPKNATARRLGSATKPPVVTKNDMIGRAQALWQEDGSRKICLLNPENASVVGGGAFCGAPNFEECLFRITQGLAFSYLAHSILTDNLTPADGVSSPEQKKGRPSYTKDHNKDVAVTYTSHAFIAYEITMQPNQKDWYKHGYQKLPRSFPVDIVGNASVPLADPRDTQKHKEFIIGKIRAQLYAAKEMGVTDLLLTDFGCGGFNNDPALIAQWYAEAIIEGNYDQYMNIEFCVKSERNFSLFQKSFNDAMAFLRLAKIQPQEKIQALQEIAKNVPVFDEAVDYGYSRENKYQEDGTASYTSEVKLRGLPITDHNPAVALTPSKSGLVVVSLNVCAPFSPIGKNVRPEQYKEYRRFDLLPGNHEMQMNKMAAYVFEILKAGADVIPLQEVPDPHQDNLNYMRFIRELDRLVKAHQSTPSIIFSADSFAQSLQHTSGTRSCVGVIVNGATVKSVSSPVSKLNGRAAEYHIETISAQKETLVNLHADYNQQQKTLEFIHESILKGNIVAGDPNLTKIKMKLPGETAGVVYHHDIACCATVGNKALFEHNITTVADQLILPDLQVNVSFNTDKSFVVNSHSHANDIYTLYGKNDKQEHRALQFSLNQDSNLPENIKVIFKDARQNDVIVDYDPSKHHWARILLREAQDIFPKVGVPVFIESRKEMSPLLQRSVFAESQPRDSLTLLIQDVEAYVKKKKPKTDNVFEIKYAASTQFLEALKDVASNQRKPNWLLTQLKYIQVAHPELFSAAVFRKSELKGFFERAEVVAHLPLRHAASAEAEPASPSRKI